MARAAQKAVALAQQEKSTWNRADVIKYLGRLLPRSGIEPGPAAILPFFCPPDAAWQG